MHFFKVACLATTLLCLVYTGDCDLLLDGLARVANEITPLTTKIDNDITMATNILRGINATNSNTAAVTATAQAALSAVAQPFLDAISSLKAMLSGAADCVTGAAEKMAAVLVNGVIGYVNCVATGVSQIPGLMAQIQGLVTRRNDPSIVNLQSDLQSLLQQGGNVVDSVNSAVDSVKSQLTAIAADLATSAGQVVQTALSVAACAVNVKLQETEEGIKIVAGIVNCAADLGVPVTPPALPPPPADTTSIINQALAVYGNETAVSQTSAVAASIASTSSAVKTVADQAAAVTPDVIENAVSSVVQPYVTKLTLLKTLNLLNPAVQADIQSGIDKLMAVQNNGVASTSQVVSQLSQQIASLGQQLADLDDKLEQLVQNKGVSAIIACANNVIYNTPEYVKACTDAVLNNFPLELDKIMGDLAVADRAIGTLSGQVSGALSGQAAIAASQAADVYNTTMAMLATKYG